MSTFAISGGTCADEARRAGEEVVLAELVVLEAAVGVVDAAAPAVAHALLELEDRRMVLALAQVLWRMRMSLNCGNGRSSSRRWIVGLVGLLPCGNDAPLMTTFGRPKNGFGTCSSSAGPSARYCEGTWLMLMTPSFDPPRPRSRPVEPEVLEADGHVAGQLAVDVHRVLLHPGRPLVLIDELDLAVDAGQRAELVAHRLQHAVRERVVERRRPAGTGPG